MGMLASAVWDSGFSDWHRDYSSNVLAPLAGVQKDMAVNGPPYVQWNIATHDDDLFRVVPGSHVNPDSEELRQQLLLDDRVPQPGAVQADLKAGDAIVYAAYIQHWGSYYSSRMRRVISMGYFDCDKVSSFRGRTHWEMDLEFTRPLSAQTRSNFEQQVAWAMESRDVDERIFEAALAKDGGAFVTVLVSAHPEESCCMVAVAHLCRLAEKIHMLCGSDMQAGTEYQRREAEAIYGDDYWADMKSRYTPEGADGLGSHFALMTERMQADRERSDRECAEFYHRLIGANGSSPKKDPNFESRALRNHYHRMPDLTIEELVASW